MTTTAPPAAPTTRAKTTYHVLKLSTTATAPNSSGGTSMSIQLVAKDVDANNAEQAIRVYAEKVSQDGTALGGSGVYIAVPSRSWKPVTVTASTQTVIKVG